MLLGALLDAGLPLDAVRTVVDALGIPGVDITTAIETRCEVRGTRALVDVSDAPRYSPQQMLDAVAGAAELSERTREAATAVLKSLFAAEAQVHGDEPDRIHLHELGTADTLVDVVGVVHGLEQLGVERVYASPLVLGRARRTAATGRLQQPRAGDPGDHRSRRSAGGAGAAVSRRGRRADHAHRRGADYSAGR